MKTIRDISLNNKTVLIRADFNVPIENGIIKDDSRIVKSIDTINYCLNKGAKVIIMSHLGKVKTEADLNQTLKPVADRLGQLLSKKVYLIENIENPNLKKYIEGLSKENIILIENTRFADLRDQRESNCDLQLAAFWASLADIFVFDAFGAAHRDHASTGGIVRFLPTVIGLLVEREMMALNILQNPEKPCVGIMGGAKIDDKVVLIEKLLSVAENICVGGGLALPFLKVKGYNINYTDESNIIVAKDIMNNYGNRIILPIDLTVESEAITSSVDVDNLTNEHKVIDIGKKTNLLFKESTMNAKTIFWNGPMGIIEQNNGVRGTLQLIHDLAHSSGKVIIGGGDTGVLIQENNLEEAFYHVSTGGGATLNYIEKGTLVVIETIKNQNEENGIFNS